MNNERTTEYPNPFISRSAILILREILGDYIWTLQEASRSAGVEFDWEEAKKALSDNYNLPAEHRADFWRILEEDLLNCGDCGDYITRTSDPQESKAICAPCYDKALTAAVEEGI